MEEVLRQKQIFAANGFIDTENGAVFNSKEALKHARQKAEEERRKKEKRAAEDCCKSIEADKRLKQQLQFCTQYKDKVYLHESVFAENP